MGGAVFVSPSGGFPGDWLSFALGGVADYNILIHRAEETAHWLRSLVLLGSHGACL